MSFRHVFLLMSTCAVYAGIVVKPCPPGWTEYEHSCYRYFSSLKSWTEAQSTCQNVGANGYSSGEAYQTADLTSIHSAEEQDFVKNYWLSCRDSVTPHASSLWIGLNDPERNQQFKWVDGSNVDYTNWNTAEPNNYNNLGEYYVLLGTSGKWNDFTESGRAPFICKMPRQCECFFL